MNSKRQRGQQPLDGALNPNAETASQQGPVNDNEDKEGAGRRERIAVAAYYKAERRGFGEGGEHDDWLEAEKDIDRKDQHEERRSQLQDAVGTPDHMVAREPLPPSQPHDPGSGHIRAAASKKPERRKTARTR
jgi:hypothetical protein